MASETSDIEQICADIENEIHGGANPKGYRTPTRYRLAHRLASTYNSGDGLRLVVLDGHYDTPDDAAAAATSLRLQWLGPCLRDGLEYPHFTVRQYLELLH